MVDGVGVSPMHMTFIVDPHYNTNIGAQVLGGITNILKLQIATCTKCQHWHSCLKRIAIQNKERVMSGSISL